MSAPQTLVRACQTCGTTRRNVVLIPEIKDPEVISLRCLACHERTEWAIVRYEPYVSRVRPLFPVERR
jgi:hypothetical protein